MFNQLKGFKFSDALSNDTISPITKPTSGFKSLFADAVLGFADLFSSDNTLPQRGNGLGDVLPSSYGSQNPPNNQQMLAAEVMLPVVLQDKMGNVIDRQNIPTKISLINTGGLMLSPFET